MNPSTSVFPPGVPTASAATTQGRCLVCGKAVLSGERGLRLAADVVHERCGLYQPRARAVAQAEARR